MVRHVRRTPFERQHEHLAVAAIVGFVREQVFPDIDFGVTFLPGEKGGESSFAGGDSIAIPAGSKFPAEAFEFIKWATSKDIVLKTQGEGAVPGARDSVWADPAGSAAFPADWVTAVAASSNGRGYDRPLVTAVTEARDIIGGAVTVSIEGGDFETAANDANAQFQALLAHVREGDVVTGTVSRVEARNVILDLGKTEASLPQQEQVPTERYEPGTRLKCYVVEVRKTNRGPMVVLSRTHPGLLKRLLELEIPEISEGVVEIRGIAREAGARSKVAVLARDPNVDPVGACVGPRGARIQAVVSELAGEKIDVIPWSEDYSTFIANALSPAKVVEVRPDFISKVAMVIVPDYQLSLAIGREGQNARLAAKITGWKIDIKSEAQVGLGGIPRFEIDF